MLATSEHRESLSVIFAHCSGEREWEQTFWQGNMRERVGGGPHWSKCRGCNPKKWSTTASFFWVLHFLGLRARLVLGRPRASRHGWANSPNSAIDCIARRTRWKLAGWARCAHWPGGQDHVKIKAMDQHGTRWNQIQTSKKAPTVTSAIFICAREAHLEDWCKL